MQHRGGRTFGAIGCRSPEQLRRRDATFASEMATDVSDDWRADVRQRFVRVIRDGA
jgi:hypothetical protein